MERSLALVPEIIASKGNRTAANVSSVLLGTLVLAVLAQISIPLPFTPVPITGQTFGVALLALLWGQKRASATFGLYLLEGAAGLPVFALGKSGLLLGPTTGYLVGMFLACWVVGGLADRGYAKKWSSAFGSCVLGSLCVFGFGLLGLSFFMPTSVLLATGLLPFLLGDLVKNLLASTIASRVSRKKTSL